MEKELAEKVYLYILEKFNGFTEEMFAELSPEEIYSDEVYEDLCKLEVKNEHTKNNNYKRLGI
jgi:hypothetical protein